MFAETQAEIINTLHHYPSCSYRISQLHRFYVFCETEAGMPGRIPAGGYGKKVIIPFEGGARRVELEYPDAS
jgi:hypothetical protein